VRGLRKKRVVPYVIDLMKEKSPDFVCFQETILQDFSDSFLRMIDPAREYQWDWIPVVGKYRGALSGIKSERFDMGSREQGNYRLWDKKWKLSELWEMCMVLLMQTIRKSILLSWLPLVQR
jgi:hypothetical protein